MSEQPFFPAGIFDRDPEQPSLHNGWYSQFLRAMGEDPLFPTAPDRPPVYRFIFLPTFSSPRLVRANQTKAGWVLVSKTNDGHGGYFPGPNTSQTERELRPTECKEVEKAFQKLSFWVLPTNEGRL